MLPVLYIAFFLVILLLTLSPEVERALADSVIATISVGKFPQAIIFNPSNNNIYVANVISNTVSVIDSDINEVTDEVDVGYDPGDLEYNPSNNNIYVANRGLWDSVNN
jgi:YVTN family beta-propeller protein